MEEPQNIRQNLSKLALAGFGWQFLNRVGRQVVQLGISIVLARLLLPSDYGLVGMTAIFVTLAQMLSELGFTGAIVQKKDVTGEQLQTVFWMNILVSVGLWGLAWLAAPWIARFYNEPLVGPIFIASTLVMVLMAPSGVPRSLMYKQMQFRESFFMDWASMLTGGLISIVLAFRGAGVWSLVAGNLANALVVTGVAWRFCPWRPHWTLNPASIKGMTRFSTHYLNTRLFQGVMGNLDYMVIGKFFLPAELGLYFLAFRLMELFRTQLTLMIQSVMYPVFIHLQEDDRRTQEVLYKLGLSTSLLVFPALTGLMAVAPDFINLVYGPKWVEAAPLLRLLVWAGMFYAVDQSVFVMNARGKADWVFWITLLKTGLFLVFLLVGATYGLLYVAALVSIHAMITTLFFQRWVNRITGFTYGQYFRSLAPAGFISFFLGLAVFLTKGLLASSGYPLSVVLGVQVAVGAIVLGVAILLWPGDDIRQLALWLQIRIPRLAHSTWLTQILQHWGAWRFYQRKYF